MDKNILIKMNEVQDDQWWFKARRKILMDKIQTFNLPAKAKILDIGCGTGANLAAQREILPEAVITGLDIDQICRDACKARGFDVIDGDVRNLPFPDESFDLINFLDVLEHIDDEQQTLHELFRTLKSGGRILLTVPALPFLWGEHDRLSCHYRRYTFKSLKTALTQNGFDLEYISYFNFFLLPIAILVRIFENLFQCYRDEQKIPSKFVNDFFYSIFSSESKFISSNRHLPLGLSLLAVVKKKTSVG